MSFTNESTVLMHDCFRVISVERLSRWHLPYLFPEEFSSAVYPLPKDGDSVDAGFATPVQVWSSEGYVSGRGTRGEVIPLPVELRKAIAACMAMPVEVIQQIPVQVMQTYLPAISRTKPGYIRYLARPEHLSNDRWTIVKAGRFLRRHCPQLSDEDVKQLTARITGACAVYSLEFTEPGDGDKIADVYRYGPNSCQSGYKPYHHGDIEVDGDFYAPVRIYGHPDNNLRLAYLVDSDGHYAARAWVNIETMTHNTVYSSEDTFKGSDLVMEAFLQEHGYTEDGEETMRGEVLLKVVTDCGAIICPYIDPGNMGVKVYDCNLVIGGPHEANYETGCLLAYDLDKEDHYCDHCGERDHADDLNFVAVSELHVCDSCLDSEYVYAEAGGYFGYSLVPVSEARTLVCGDVVHRALLSTGDFVALEWGQYTGEWCRADEAVHCESKGWCYIDDVQEQGLSMCHCCSTLMHPDDDGACPECGEEDNYKV